jgi:hypothetical protein
MPGSCWLGSIDLITDCGTNVQTLVSRASVSEHERAAHSPAVQTPGPHICPQSLIVALGVLATVGLGVLEASK